MYRCNKIKQFNFSTVFLTLLILWIVICGTIHMLKHQGILFFGDTIPSPDHSKTIYIQTYNYDRSCYLVNEDKKEKGGMVWPKESFSASWADNSTLYAVGYQQDELMKLYVIDLADHSTTPIHARINDTILYTLGNDTTGYGFQADLEQDISIELIRWCKDSEDMILSFTVYDTNGNTHTGYCLFEYRSYDIMIFYVN